MLETAPVLSIPEENIVCLNLNFTHAKIKMSDYKSRTNSAICKKLHWYRLQELVPVCIFYICDLNISQEPNFPHLLIFEKTPWLKEGTVIFYISHYIFQIFVWKYQFPQSKFIQKKNYTSPHRSFNSYLRNLQFLEYYFKMDFRIPKSCTRPIGPKAWDMSHKQLSGQLLYWYLKCSHALPPHVISHPQTMLLPAPFWECQACLIPR